jgi:chromosome segregation ATPase
MENTTSSSQTRSPLLIYEPDQNQNSTETKSEGAQSSNCCGYIFTVVCDSVKSLFDLFIYYISCCPSKTEDDSSASGKVREDSADLNKTSADENLKLANSSLSEENKELKERVTDLEKDLGELRTRKEELEENVKTTKKTTIDTEATFKTRLIEASNENARLSSVIQKDLKSKDKEIEDLKKKIVNLQNENTTTLDDKLMKLRAENDELQLKVALLSKEKETHEEAIREAVEKAKNVSSITIKTLEDENRMAKLSLEQVERDRNNTIEQKKISDSKIETLTKELDTEKAKIAELNRTYLVQIGNYKDDIEKGKKEIKDVSKFQEEIKRLKTNNAKLLENVEKLEDIKRNNNKEIDKIKRELGDAKTMIGDQERIIEQLKRSNKESINAS